MRRLCLSDANGGIQGGFFVSFFFFIVNDLFVFCLNDRNDQSHVKGRKLTLVFFYTRPTLIVVFNFNTEIFPECFDGKNNALSRRFRETLKAHQLRNDADKCT